MYKLFVKEINMYFKIIKYLGNNVLFSFVLVGTYAKDMRNSELLFYSQGSLVK